MDGKLVPLGQASRRRLVGLDHLARRGHGSLGSGRVPGRARPDGKLGGGVHRGDRELAEDDGVVHRDEPAEPFESDRQGGRRITVPQRDLRPERVQVDDELRILERVGLGSGDREVASSRDQIAGPHVQVGQRHMEVDRGHAREHALEVALEQFGRLRVARELDQHRRRVDLRNVRKLSSLL